MDPRWFVVVLSNLLLAFLIEQANHSLAPLSVTLIASGLFVPVAALRLSFRPGLVAMFITGLFVDASHPGAYGLTAICLATLFTIGHAIREQLPRETRLASTTSALVANLALFAVQAITLGEADAATYLRTLTDFGLAIIAPLIAAPWFFALQERTLILCGVDLSDEKRRT